MPSDDRGTQILTILRSAAGPLSGEELARLLGVSTRSVRQFVKDLNQRSGGDLVRSNRLGYSLDQGAYERVAVSDSSEATRYETPQQRLFTIARQLVSDPAGADIFELADQLAVSEATIEADLVRARELFRHNDLVLRRDHDRVRVEGSERQQRRLMRQIVVSSSEGLTPAALQAFAADYAGYDLSRLRQGVLTALSSLPVDINEYVLNDVLIHLTIAADRVRTGRTVDPPELDEDRIDDVTQHAVVRLAAAVEQAYGVELPSGEQRALYGLLATRLNRRADRELDPAIIDPATMAMVRDAITDLSDQYLLEFSDEATILNLALHVENLLARATSGQSLRNPLGATFKNQHPLIHELALYFAHKIEATTGITVGEGELDFLSFHLGTQFQRQLDASNRVRITLVVPRYHQTHEIAEARLAEALGAQAFIERVITSVDHDWSSIASDLVVTAVDLTGRTPIRIVPISPLLTQADIDAVLEAVRRERHRAEGAKIRAATSNLMDPEFFLHLPQVDSKEDALAIMCHQLVAAGVVHDSFYDDVLDREQRSSTAFGGPFAIPHSMFMDARRTAIAVLVSDRPIPWGTSTVRLVVLFALSPDGRQIFRDVLDKLIGLLAEPATTSRLLAASGSHSDFITALADLLEA